MELEELLKQMGGSDQLQVDIPCKLLLSLEGVESNLHATLVGMETAKYLIISTPQIDARVRGKFQPGVPMVVKYLYAGSIFAFQSTVLSAVNKPFNLTFSTFPKIVSRHELRKADRAECFLPAAIQLGEANLAGSIIDISTGGCRFVCKKRASAKVPQLTADAEFEIYFKLGSKTSAQKVKGVARSILNERDMVAVGIEFMDVSPEQNFSLSKFVRESLDIVELKERLRRQG
jgi:c-di-GMP-binding flagellar brake protein YcgR